MPSESYGGEVMRKVFLNGINGSKRVAKTWKMMKQVGSQRSDENVEKVWNLVHSDKCLSVRALTVQLNLDKETVTCVERGLNFSPMTGFSTVTMLLQTQHSLSSSFWPKIDY
jgi:arginyl-tRNA--protein-N-Asp/Glu arginylyltransferase